MDQIHLIQIRNQYFEIELEKMLKMTTSVCQLLKHVLLQNEKNQHVTS